MTSQEKKDQEYMTHALAVARKAAEAGEVPVGAVLVRDEKIIAAAGNEVIARHDPTGHAEIRVLRRAALEIGNYRLPETTLYVTLEPCLMCIGAIIHARIQRLVYGATDPKGGAACSLYPIASDARLNHRLEVTSGVLASSCSEILKEFFRARRHSPRGM